MRLTIEISDARGLLDENGLQWTSRTVGCFNSNMVHLEGPDGVEIDARCILLHSEHDDQTYAMLRLDGYSDIARYMALLEA